VCGGGFGHTYVYDARTGAHVADIPLATDGNPTFINDNLIIGDAVYYTDSFRQSFFRLALDQGGRLPGHPEVKEIPLGGDFQFVPLAADGSRAFNSNGIELTPDGKALIIVNSFTGLLYRVDPQSGVAKQIDVGGATFPTGDGLLVLGSTLYVAQNTNNVAVIALDKKGDKGTVVQNITNKNFNTLATLTFLDGALYITNPDFPHTNPVGIPFTVVRVPIDK
jgi:sugar lactone lactonase YvrE